MAPTHHVQPRLRRTAAPHARLVLPFELRQRSRLLAALDSGEEVGLLLPRGTVLRGGDRLQSSDGRIVEVVAAPEAALDRAQQRMRASSRARPITSATGTSPCRSPRIRCATCRTMCSTTCCAAWASQVRQRRAALRAGGRCLFAGALHLRADARALARPRPFACPRLTTEPLALLRLLQLASPALPIGAFNFSQGLELAIELQWIRDEASASRLDRRLSRGTAWPRSTCRCCCACMRALRTRMSRLPSA